MLRLSFRNLLFAALPLSPSSTVSVPFSQFWWEAPFYQSVMSALHSHPCDLNARGAIGVNLLAVHGINTSGPYSRCCTPAHGFFLPHFL